MPNLIGLPIHNLFFLFPATMLQIVESCTMSPSRSSLITHSYVATQTEKGIQANIFIETPQDPNYSFVSSKSVYLVTCQENQAFTEFLKSHPNAVILTIPMYITVLQFFRVNWPNMKNNVEIQFSKIRKNPSPIELDPHIHFSLSAICSYEMALEDAVLGFQKTSDDFSPTIFYLTRNGQSVLLNADTMQKLAEATTQTLVNTLYKAGYVDSTSQSEHE
jgi:hypothetical protein